MAEKQQTHAVVTGRIRAGSRAIRGVLVEAFDTPDYFQQYIPLADRHALAKHELTRLGSDITNVSGQFTISYDVSRLRKGRFAKRQCVNLWVIASAGRKDSKDPAIIYQSGDVRRCAGAIEQYAICVSEDSADVSNGIAPIDTGPTPATIAQNFLEQQKLREAELSVSKERFKQREVIRADFRKNVAPKIRTKMSLVNLTDAGKPDDDHFVKPEDSVRQIAEQRMIAAIQKNLAANLKPQDTLYLKGRLSLTAAQRSALEVAAEISDVNTLTVDEEVLTRILGGGEKSGLNPESGKQIVNRVNAIEQYCRGRTKAEQCLEQPPPRPNNENGTGNDDDGAEDDIPTIEVSSLTDGEGTGNHDNGSDDGEPAIELSSRTHRRDRTSANITVESLRGELPRFIAKILDETSVLDPGANALPEPGTQLNEETIGAAGSFPSLTLPPGPADVPAYHDFFDLQIAFKAVWQEALDESVIGDAEALYEHYVENGGDPAVFLDVIFPMTNLNVTWTLAAPPQEVQRHIDVTNEEWSVLQLTQRSALKSIATEIANALKFLHKDKLQDNDFTDGVTSDDLNTFNNTRSYVLAKVGELREQGDRLVRVSRAELERHAAGKSIVPNSAVLKQLRQRAVSAYPAKYFAANKRQRSVNFGVLVTYRQRWTPTAYQVGELIKSIPLAPKEVRKFSKRIVKKERRARKEIESNLESMKSETNATTRSEADIVQKAMEKTNFNASANGSLTIGVWSGGGSSALTQDAEDNSSETKKSFHEAVVKAAREYRNEIKIELETDTTTESEFQESGELTNPHGESSVTYLIYELQRRYRVEERLHRLTSVVLVAQEMPNPGEIDEDWLVAHRWILNRVLLDDALKQPLAYVAEGLVAEQFALEEMRNSLAQQRRLVEELKEDISESRVLTESRYSALQHSMERTARATQRKSKGGGLFGFVKKLVTPPVIEGFVDQFIGGSGGDTPEAARIREAAAQDAYQRELQRLRDLEGQLAQSNASLTRATSEYTDRLAQHLGNVVRVTELRNHVKDNITHYMQAIWMHEPFQQRWLRLKDVPVPVLKRPSGSKRRYVIGKRAIKDSLANVTHLKTSIYEYTTFPQLTVPDGGTNGKLDTVPLYEVADIDDLMGFRANYMIFPMRKANAITDFMMEPYVEKAAGAYGISDPDDLGNVSLDEFADYVCCLKEQMEADEFEALKDTLKAQLKKLLQSPLRDDEEIVVPMDATYMEALPGATPILENFQLLHRQIDAADAQEVLRMKKLEKLRYAQRLLDGAIDDPDVNGQYVFRGVESANVSVTPGGGP